MQAGAHGRVRLVTICESRMDLLRRIGSVRMSAKTPSAPFELPMPRTLKITSTGKEGRRRAFLTRGPSKKRKVPSREDGSVPLASPVLIKMQKSPSREDGNVPLATLVPSKSAYVAPGSNGMISCQEGQKQAWDDGRVHLMTKHLSDTHSAFGLNGTISGREIQKQVRGDGYVPLVAVCAVNAQGGALARIVSFRVRNVRSKHGW